MLGDGAQKRRASKFNTSAFCDIYFSINSWHLYCCDRSISLSQCSSPLTLSFNYPMVPLSPQGDCKRNIYNFKLPRSRAGDPLKALGWIISSTLDNRTFREFPFFSSLLNSDSYTEKAKEYNSSCTVLVFRDSKMTQEHLGDHRISKQEGALPARSPLPVRILRCRQQIWVTKKSGTRELAARLAGDSRFMGDEKIRLGNGRNQGRSGGLGRRSSMPSGCSFCPWRLSLGSKSPCGFFGVRSGREGTWDDLCLGPTPNTQVGILTAIRIRMPLGRGSD